MTTAPLFLSAVTHYHGEPHPIAELDEPMPMDLTLPQHGLQHYCVSELPTKEIAAQLASRTHELSGVAPDLLIYVTENDRNATESLAHIARTLNLPRVEYIAVSGHACANLGPALSLAQRAMASGEHKRALLVMADRAADHGRVMNTGLSVFSDGGAACMLTAHKPDQGGPHFAVHAVTTRVRVDVDPQNPGHVITSTVELAEACMADVLTRGGHARDSYAHILFANYRISSQHFLAAAMGYSPDRVLVGPVAELAHCFSADLLTNLTSFVSARRIERRARMLVSATGPYTWSMMDVEWL